jgi:hypothetical protein
MIEETKIMKTEITSPLYFNFYVLKLHKFTWLLPLYSKGISLSSSYLCPESDHLCANPYVHDLCLAWN